MTLEAALWREVGQHLELEESVRLIGPILRLHLAIGAFWLRRVDRDAPRLTTVAADGASAEPKRTELSADELQALLASAAARELCVLRSDDPTHSLLWARGESEQAILAGPLRVGGRVDAFAVFALRPGARSELDLGALSAALGPLSVAFENDQRLHELARMRASLEADRAALLTRLGRQDITELVIGRGLEPIMRQVEQVAPTDAPVLILGETGSGKEVIARAVHARSARTAGPFVRVNCGAIPPELVDSELFGHERGAFTGAVGQRKGWFERADGGTLFLDEVGELPPAAQVRLLRVLQDGSLERVGGHSTLSVDVRIVAATHRRLEAMVVAGSFREDLWYRLSVFPMRLPPLRERPGDVPALAAHFAARAGVRFGGHPLRLSEDDQVLLSSYPWPGNVRELGAVIERAAILGSGRKLDLHGALGASALSDVRRSDPPLDTPTAVEQPPREQPSTLVPPASDTPRSFPTLDEAQRRHIERALQLTHGRIEGTFGAAKLLGVNPHTLRARMRKLGVDWARYRPPGG